MPTLTHFRLCPHSRAVRLAAAELGLDCELVEERPWEWRQEFLALNPAGELPVLELDNGTTLCGIYAISEFLAEGLASSEETAPAILLFPGDAVHRAEVRRLVDWFVHKFHREVTQELLQEKVYARLQPHAAATPDVDFLRAIRSNLRYHLSYVNYLADRGRWLAGDELSFADLAAAAQISAADYLGEVAWEDYPIAKTWYARLKSRRSFRSLLGDRLAGTMPAAHYADLDF
jgi:glutathione S-transferase